MSAKWLDQLAQRQVNAHGHLACCKLNHVIGHIMQASERGVHARDVKFTDRVAHENRTLVCHIIDVEQIVSVYVGVLSDHKYMQWMHRLVSKFRTPATRSAIQSNQDNGCVEHHTHCVNGRVCACAQVKHVM